MSKIADEKFRAFAYEVLHLSFGDPDAREISVDDIHALGLQFGLLFEDEANKSDCERWTDAEIEPGDTIYRIMLMLSLSQWQQLVL